MARPLTPTDHLARRRLWLTVVAGMALAAAMALCVALGLWQLRRADEKAAQQAALDQARAAPAMNLAGPSVSLAQWDGRRVVVQGTLASEFTLFLDNRTHRGVAGFEVVTPLRLARPVVPQGSTTAYDALLVARGWVPRDPQNRTRLPEISTPTGLVQFEGRVLAHWVQPRVLGGAQAPAEAGGRLVQHLDWDEVARRSGLRLAPVLIRQTAAWDDGLVREWVEPGPRVAKHHAYAAQWFGLAAALAVYAVLGWRRQWRKRTTAAPDLCAGSSIPPGPPIKGDQSPLS